MIQYAAIDDDGNILGVKETVEGAIDLVRQECPGVPIQVEDVDSYDPHLEPNPPMPSSKFLREAIRRCGIPQMDYDEVMSMSLSEAKARLDPYFADMAESWGDLKYMVENWLRDNQKLEKEHPDYPAKVLGLNFVPADLTTMIRDGETPLDKSFVRSFKKKLPTLPDDFSLCVGSNELCRKSCLIYSGQNASADYNTHIKAAQTAAFLNEPQASLRMLSAALDLLSCLAPTMALSPVARLNVLSDIPWEHIAPWLFEEHEDIQFYDYTKLTGRHNLPDNYDLTFSFSGSNEKQSKAELRKGRRVAVVFLAYREKKLKTTSRWEMYRALGDYKWPLPGEFWGTEVVDGDETDLRFLDDDGVIVGLRWKSASSKKRGEEVTPENNAFVTPVYIVDGEGRLKSNPNGSTRQWLVASVTPRMQGLDSDVWLDEE